MNNTYFITGATGYLGSHFVSELLREDKHARIVCFVRGNRFESGHERMRQALLLARKVENQPFFGHEWERVQPVDFNPLSQDQASLPPDLKTRSENSRAFFWHIAATVSFNETSDSTIRRTNFEGAANALRNALALGVSEFNLVSTAYVAGKARGLIKPLPADDTREFNNDYEASKCEAEKFAAAFCSENGINLRILRPSIIGGHSETRQSFNRTGIYKYAELISEFYDTYGPASRSESESMKISVPDWASCNVIPIDICVKEMIAAASVPTGFGKAIHICAKASANHTILHRAISRAFGSPLDAADHAPHELNRKERILSKVLVPYSAYYTDKEFCRKSLLSLVNEDPQGQIEYGQDLFDAWIDCHARFRRETKARLLESEFFSECQGLGSHFNITDSILSADRAPSRLALLSEGEPVTYGDLSERANLFANWLVTRGARQGREIALINSESSDHIAMMLAIMRIGAVCVNFNPLMSLATIEQLIQAHRITVVITDQPQVLDRKLQDHTIAVLALPSVSQARHELGGSAPKLLSAYTSPHDPCFCVFSSGTTGESKKISHTHKDIVAAFESYGKQFLAIKESDRVFSASRTSFAFGLQNLFLALLNHCTYIVGPENIKTHTLIDTINRSRPTVFFAVPTVYQFILASEQPLTGFVETRLFISAGERLPEGIYRRWFERFNSNILDSLGSTEAFSTYISNIPDAAYTGATGKLVPGFSAEIRNPENKLCGYGEPGVLWLKGPSLSASVMKMPGLDASQWFCTQDIFSLDRDGYYHFKGRNNEMIKVAGQWVSPNEIEDCLSMHPLVEEVGVVADNNDSVTTTILAFVVAKPGSDQNQLIIELKSLCKRSLEVWKYPQKIIFTDFVEKTLTGKKMRFKLREKAALIDRKALQHA